MDSEKNIQNDIWYHVSNKNFDKVNINICYEGFWLTRDLNSIINGETGASLKSHNIFVHKFSAKNIENVAGWDEYNDMFSDQIIERGFQATLLNDDLVVYDVDELKKIETLKIDLKNPEDIESLKNNNLKIKTRKKLK